MKTAFLISGFTLDRTTADPKYTELRSAIERAGYHIVTTPITWNHKTVQQFADQFITFYQRHKSDYNVVIGNSYGAMVAFIAAPQIQPDKVILCSLSPYFAEDADKTTREHRIKRFGKLREAAMRQLSAKDTASALNNTDVPVVMLYGEQEETIYPSLVERVKATGQDLDNATVVKVPQAPHSFSDPRYVAAIVTYL